MAIINVTKNDIAQRRTDPAHLITDFIGRDGQLVIDVNDEYRPVIMDGITQGGKAKAALLHSAPFSIHPTVPTADDTVKISDEMLVNKAEANMLIKETLGGLPEEGEPTIYEQLQSKLDKTVVREEVDANELLEDGLFKLTSCTNTPNGYDGICHVYTDSNSLVQVFYSLEPEGVGLFFRRKLSVAESFSQWYSVPLLDDLSNLVLSNKENEFTANQTFSGNVSIKGTLKNATVAKKVNHTALAKDTTDFNTLTSDGLWQVVSDATLNNRPDSQVTNYFVHVFNQDNNTVQLAFSLSGSMYLRGKSNIGTWTQWVNVGSISDATEEIKGIVQLSNTIDDSTDKAITPKAVNTVKKTADEAALAAEANEQTITELSLRVNDVIADYAALQEAIKYAVKSVNNVLPDATGNVTLNLASELKAGIVFLATVAESQDGTDGTKAVTPAGVKLAVKTNLQSALDDPSVIEKLKNNIGIVTATTKQEGITTLSNTIEDDDTKAATPRALYKLKQDSLSLSTGGNILTTQVSMPSHPNSTIDTVNDSYLMNKADIVKLIKSIAPSISGPSGDIIKLVSSEAEVGTSENVFYFIVE